MLISVDIDVDVEELALPSLVLLGLLPEVVAVHPARHLQCPRHALTAHAIRGYVRDVNSVASIEVVEGLTIARRVTNGSVTDQLLRPGAHAASGCCGVVDELGAR